MTTNTCQTCRHWTRNDLRNSFRTVTAPETPEYGVCSHPRIARYDPVIGGGPDEFYPDGVYAETDYIEFGLYTGQNFGCVHWNEDDDDDHAE